MRLSAKDIYARMFARIALSGHVGYISLDATFFIYCEKGTVTFGAALDAGPR